MHMRTWCTVVLSLFLVLSIISCDRQEPESSQTRKESVAAERSDTGRIPSKSGTQPTGDTTAESAAHSRQGWQPASAPPVSATLPVELNASNYFPIEVGATWRYRITVRPRRSVFHAIEYTVDNDSSWSQPLPSGITLANIGQRGPVSGGKAYRGTFTLKVLSLTQDGRSYTVKVEPDECSYGYYSAFEDPVRLTWDTTGATVWETLVGKFDTEPSNIELTAQRLLAHFRPGFTAVRSGEEDKAQERAAVWRIYCRKSESDTTVPAGTFAHCVENICRIGRSPSQIWEEAGKKALVEYKMVRLTVGNANKFRDFLFLQRDIGPRPLGTDEVVAYHPPLFVDGWTVKRVFAANVGMILESQTDILGEENYRIELVSFYIPQ